MIEHNLLGAGSARAYIPSDSGESEVGTHGYLAESSIGDWSWKPDRYRYVKADDIYIYRLAITGPRCTCTLAHPVGTNCARHN